MHRSFNTLLIVISSLFGWLYSEDLSPLANVPVLYQGRFIPLEVYCKHWISEINGSDYLKNYPSPSEILLKLHFLGSKSLETTPLFEVADKVLRNSLGTKKYASIKKLKNAFFDNQATSLQLLSPVILSSFAETYTSASNRGRNTTLELSTLCLGLKAKLINNSIAIVSVPNAKPWNNLTKGTTIGSFNETNKKNKVLAGCTLSLLQKLQRLELMTGTQNKTEIEYENLFKYLLEEGRPPKEIQRQLEAQFPLEERLTRAGSTFNSLPSLHKKELWYPLKALKIKVFDPSTNTLRPIKNFTAYSDTIFSEIRSNYLNLERAFLQNRYKNEASQLAESLIKGYRSIAGLPYQQATGKKLYFPSLFKLKIESYFYRTPFTTMIICGYISSVISILLYLKWPSRALSFNAWALGSATFLLHSSNIAIRCYLLSRPPVSNMAETVLFVPWVGVVAALTLSYFYKTSLPIICSFLGSAILFIILKYSKTSLALENVQAVLDSQFWLTIHVLMIVGSYGAFALSGVLGHFYLLMERVANTSKKRLNSVGKLIQLSMFLGLTLLIPGTILGGVWAAESWGRFWDWDPKESWAFITSCIYLICIHSHYFGLIRYYGLAIGSILGLMVVGFTWYGVNYILGTGLHSYGFGSGGEDYFYIYLATETIFLVFISIVGYVYSPRVKHLSQM